MAIPAPGVNVGRRRRRARSPQRRCRSRSRSLSPRERRAREDSEEARERIREMREVEARDAEERRRRILHASLLPYFLKELILQHDYSKYNDDISDHPNKNLTMQPENEEQMFQFLKDIIIKDDTHYLFGMVTQLDLYFLSRMLKRPKFGGKLSQLTVAYFGDAHIKNLYQFFTEQGIFKTVASSNKWSISYPGDKCIDLNNSYEYRDFTLPLHIRNMKKILLGTESPIKVANTFLTYCRDKFRMGFPFLLEQLYDNYPDLMYIYDHVKEQIKDEDDVNELHFYETDIDLIGKIQKLIEDLLHKNEVEIHKTFDTLTYYLDRKEIDSKDKWFLKHFPKSISQQHRYILILAISKAYVNKRIPYSLKKKLRDLFEIDYYSYQKMFNKFHAI